MKHYLITAKTLRQLVEALDETYSSLSLNQHTAFEALKKEIRLNTRCREWYEKNIEAIVNGLGAHPAYRDIRTEVEARFKNGEERYGRLLKRVLHLTNTDEEITFEEMIGWMTDDVYDRVLRAEQLAEQRANHKDVQ